MYTHPSINKIEVSACDIIITIYYMHMNILTKILTCLFKNLDILVTVAATINSQSESKVSKQMKCTCKVGNNGGWYTFRQLRSPFPIFTVYHIVTFHLVQAEVLATRHQHRPMGEMCVFLKKHNNIFMM